MSGPFRHPPDGWQPRLDVVDPLELDHGKLQPWRAQGAPCVACGAVPEDGCDTYSINGGSANGLPCKVVVGVGWFPWWDKHCGDPRPHLHVTCKLCRLQFKTHVASAAHGA